MSTAALYQKLRPYLRVQALDNDRSSAERRRLRWANREVKRTLLSVRCPGSYMWGHFWGCIVWNPAEPTEMEVRMARGRPTYEQFCTWYNVDLEEVASDGLLPGGLQ